ncbi:MAG: fatty acid desaturase [Myxococcota bacterium]|nr:fatty acid desaturase [Myxococcota bacterium]
MGIALHDPTYCAPATPGVLERLVTRFIYDRRDLPFVKLMGLLAIIIVPTGAVLFSPVLAGTLFWALAGVHVALVIYFLGPYVLMLHNTSHRRLFRRPWAWMNVFIPTVLGPFFGQSPETYFAHHVGMHHPENNLEDDLSTTLPYQRDSFLDFMRYFLRFFFGGIFELTRYFGRKKRRALMVRCAAGELFFWVAVLALSVCSWRATLVVFIAPLVITRFAMMAGNWAQHAFVDESSPANSYRNSITCINCSYNRRCFNDGYHIGHHLKSTRHWTEMPGELAENLGTYESQGAVLFAGIDFFGVWFCLMLRRYDWLARRFVSLGETRPSTDEIVALLQSRTRWKRSAA